MVQGQPQLPTAATDSDFARRILSDSGGVSIAIPWVAKISLRSEVFMPLDLAPFHLDLTFMAPLSEQRANQLVDFVSKNLDGTVIDIGCGWAELPIRVLEGTPGERGTGVNLPESSNQHAQTLARKRGGANRITLIAG